MVLHLPPVKPLWTLLSPFILLVNQESYGLCSEIQLGDAPKGSLLSRCCSLKGYKLEARRTRKGGGKSHGERNQPLDY